MRVILFLHLVTSAEHALNAAKRPFRMPTHAPSLPSPGVLVEGKEDALKRPGPRFTYHLSTSGVPLSPPIRCDPMPDWNWWLNSNAGLYTRIAIGCSIFALLATIDLFRNGRSATRWREYVFLLLAVGLAMAYGAINDAIASRVSWEFFYYGKGVAQQLGPAIPPDPAALESAAIGVGLRATWSAGLVIGVALLIANNPRPNRTRLRYQTLIALLIPIFLIAALSAAIGALIGLSLIHI